MSRKSNVYSNININDVNIKQLPDKKGVKETKLLYEGTANRNSSFKR